MQRMYNKLDKKKKVAVESDMEINMNRISI